MSMYLDQERAKGTYLVFESSFPLLLPVQLLKHRGNHVKCLSKDTTSELVGLFPHYPFNAKLQAGKL